MKERPLHELKCWPIPFHAVRRGEKTYELRTNDRDFEVGDHLWLREFVPNNGRKEPGFYTGESERRVITYITKGGDWGLPENLCVLALGVAK